MTAMVLVGAQWGDEGKGKVVDLYTRYADIVVRYGGGANAGHTLVVDGEKVVFHLMPSGALHPSTVCVLGSGMVIDPQGLQEELGLMQAKGLLRDGRIKVSDAAHVVLPHHKSVDKARDQGASAIGTTHRGIGPAYEDKAGRRGIRIGHLARPDLLKARLAANISAWRPVLEAHGETVPDLDALHEALCAFGKVIAPMVTETGRWLDEQIRQGKKVLLEGAQGTLLDLDIGTYPYVTSSSVVSAGACLGSGISPFRLQGCIGITKAYTTRVGAGPFPTELEGEVAHRLSTQGHEVGATTGRPRRCGWLDIPALRLAVRVNGIDKLVLTKLDVLSGFDTVQLCTHYRVHGETMDTPPSCDWHLVEPVYQAMQGWQENIQGCRSREALPKAAQTYVDEVAKLLDVPIEVVSVGAEREAILGLRDPFAQHA